MSFSDILSDKFLNSFSGNVSMRVVLITVAIAFFFSLIIFFTYKFTSKNIIYSRNFNIATSLMTIVTSAVVLSMQANIVVSLGMVGALSIVRFRTAVKEPRDLLFLFWAITNGIIIGAGAYSIVCILSIVMIGSLLLFDIFPVRTMPYLLIICATDLTIEEEINEVLNSNKIKYKIKSRNASKEKVDIIYELSNDNKEIINKISKIKKINSINMISQDGECQF